MVGRLRRMWERDRPLTCVRGVLLLALLVCLGRVAFGTDPWSDGVAERIAKGAPVRPVDYADTWGWWTAVAIAPVLALLLAWAPRWLVRDEPLRHPEFAGANTGRVFAALVAGAMLAGGALALPRLSQSLFEDERYNVQWSIDGFYLVDKRTEKLRFHEPSWSDTFWHYKWPNNHVPHTILARVSLGAWRGAARPESRLVDETALRIPAFVFGLGSIAAIALALRRLGHPTAGVAAAWILALHPWHLRYASEARGYSLTLCLLSLALIALARALERGTWGRWALVGVVQLLLLWTYPATIYFVLLLNAVALVLLWQRGAPELASQATRWFIVGLTAALAWVRMMAPNLAQFAEYVKQPTQDRMDVEWYQDVGSYLLAGMPWGPVTPNPRYTELSDVAGQHPALVATAAAVATALVIAGAVRWLAAGGLRRAAVPLLLLPPLLSLGFSVRSGTYLHPQYMLLALPPLVMLACVGIEGIAGRAGRGATVAALALAVALLGAATHAPRTQLRSRSIQPWRESVALTRPVSDPAAAANDAILTASWMFPSMYYDPRTVRIGGADQLRALMADADERRIPLFVNLGRPHLAARRNPELAAVLEERFESVAFLPGLLSRGPRQVFRYRGGGV